MHKSFDLIYAESCVDVPELDDDEFDEGGRGVPSDNQLSTEYDDLTWKIVFHRDDESTAAWENTPRAGSGSGSQDNFVVSGNHFLMFRSVLYGATGCACDLCLFKAL